MAEVRELVGWRFARNDREDREERGEREEREEREMVLNIRDTMDGY